MHKHERRSEVDGPECPSHRLRLDDSFMKCSALRHEERGPQAALQILSILPE